MQFRVLIAAAALIGLVAPAFAQEAANKANTNWPNYAEGDFTVSDYKFASGETLPEVKLHYRTLGTAKRNAAGQVVNGLSYTSSIGPQCDGTKEQTGTLDKAAAGERWGIIHFEGQAISMMRR